MEELHEINDFSKLYLFENLYKKERNAFITNIIFFKYFNIILLIINILLYILYIISLKDCDKGEEDGCIDDNIPTYIFQGVLVEINAFFYSLEFLFMILKHIDKFHLIYIIIFYFFLFKKKNGFTLKDHGGFNKYILILSLIIYLIFEIFILLLIKLYKKRRKIFWIIILFIITIPISFNFLIMSITSCDNYKLNLNNTSIKNSKNDGCYFINPKNCAMNLYEKFFDLNKFVKIDYNSKKNFIDFVINKTKYQSTSRIGIPYMKDSIFLKHPFHSWNMKKFLWDNYIDMDKDKDNLESPPEFEIIFDKNDKGNVKITVTANKTLIEQRKKLENPNSLLKNVLVFFFDTVSRQKFQNSLPLTSAWIEKFMKLTHKMPSENKGNSLRAYQFLKFHSVGTFTHINVKPMLYGNSMKSRSGIKINKFFRENGYITGFIMDNCNKGLIFDSVGKYSKNVVTVPWDHFGSGIFCDNNYGDSIMHFLKGTTSIIRRSLYGKQTIDLLLEYGEKFWNSYLNSRKFLLLAFNHGHEPTYSVLKYIDKPIAAFLKRLEDDNKFKDTGIIFIGDHGLHLSPIYAILSPENYFYQRDLPVFFLVLDYNKNIKIDDLYDNQQKFITPYDIYESLFHIIFGNNYKKQKINDLQRKSLFKFINETERNCNIYSEIKDINCKCIIKNFNKKF